MSKAAKSVTRREPVREAADEPARPAPVFKAPLKPRPKLFYALLGVLGVWVALLLVLYFTTVFPHRDEHAPHQRVEPNSGMTVPRSEER
jgi:hypothetical protein